MLRCASSLVIAAYDTVRLIPQDSRALPAAFLRSRPIFTTLKTFYGIVIPDKDHRIAKYQSARQRSLSRNGTDRVFLYFLNTQVKVKMPPLRTGRNTITRMHEPGGRYSPGLSSPLDSVPCHPALPATPVTPLRGPSLIASGVQTFSPTVSVTPASDHP